MNQIKTVTMIGIGAMGSFFAPRLQQTLGYENFRVMADGERQKRLERSGITINNKTYQFPIISSADQYNPVDLVLVGVKSNALIEALDQIKNQIGPDTIIISLLNGINSEQKVIEKYGEQHVLYAFMRISIAMVDYCSNYDPHGGFIYFGEKENNEYSEPVQRVKDLFDRADIPYKIPVDMVHAQWHKFMSNVGENLTCALLGIPYGGFRNSEHANVIRVKAMKEVIAIANHLGIMIGEKELQAQDKLVHTIAYHNKPSTLQDLEAGRPTEIDMFAGEVVRMGQKYNIPTPVNEFFYHAIRVLEEKNAGIIQEGV